VTVDRISASMIRRWRLVVAVVSMTTFVVLVAGGWWASQQGYVSWFGAACTDEGYDPVPSYDELVTKYKKSPYCARRVRDETWF
jgi:hypothetical protein